MKENKDRQKAVSWQKSAGYPSQESYSSNQKKLANLKKRKIKIANSLINKMIYELIIYKFY